MKPASCLVKAVPHLVDINEIDGSNFVYCCVHIAHSKYPSKNFTIAMIILGTCGYHPRVWQDHLVRVLNKHKVHEWTEVDFNTFIHQYITFVDNTEREASFFGEHLGDPHAPSI